MDEQASIEAFNAFLLRKQAHVDVELAPMQRPAQRLSCGWAFYYQSREFVDTGDFAKMLVGHGPVVIRDDGEIIEGGSLDRDPELLLSR